MYQFCFSRQSSCLVNWEVSKHHTTIVRSFRGTRMNKTRIPIICTPATMRNGWGRRITLHSGVVLHEHRVISLSLFSISHYFQSSLNWSRHLTSASWPILKVFFHISLIFPRLSCGPSRSVLPCFDGFIHNRKTFLYRRNLSLEIQTKQIMCTVIF